MTASILAGLATGLLVAFGVVFLKAIEDVDVESRRGLSNGLLAGSALLGLLALMSSPGLVAGMLAGSVLLIALLFGILYALRRQSTQTPAIAVGRPLPDFSAPDEQGEVFRIASLAGKPLLIKFFRGHW